MDEQSTISVNIQLPEGALEGLTRLVEQLRYLAEAAAGGGIAPAGPPVESGENSVFDDGRFRALGGQPTSETAAARRPADGQRASDPAGTARTGPIEGMFQSEAAAQDPAYSTPADLARLLPVSGQPAAETAAPAGESTPTTLSDAVRGVADVLGTGTERIPVSLSSGDSNFTFSQTPELSGRPWPGSRERLASASPAPVTAEAISQAFRRDERRYDSGFPLY